MAKAPAENHFYNSLRLNDGGLGTMTKAPRFGGAKSCTSMAPAQYQARLQKHAVKILAAVSHSAQAAGVACEMVQVEHEHPYQKIPVLVHR